jgi:hypothetical protein
MEGRRIPSLCTVTRSYEPHRLEEQVWALAYEQVSPLFRRTLNAPQRASQIELHQGATEAFATVRSA